MIEEEIFDKPVESKPAAKPRKKKELSQAQKDALARGRAKMAEKRAANKGKTKDQLAAEKEAKKAEKEAGEKAAV